MLLWLGLILCTAVIIYSGSGLSRYGDIIAEKSGLGRSWTGAVLMASVTSLPELFTGISSVTIAGAPDIAVGDVLGSCAFNMLILAMLDAICHPVPVTSRARQGNILSAGFGILMLSICAIGLLMGRNAGNLAWIGSYSLLFPLIYLLAVKLVYTFEKRDMSQFISEMAIELHYRDVSMRRALFGYTANGAAVVTAAMFLPNIGKGLAEITGLGETFVGTFIVAVATSLPEVVVSVAAVKMNAVDLAIGNLFGSNLFNTFILAIDDVLFLPGPILSFVSRHHAISAISAIAMTAVAVIGIIYRAEKKRLWLAWDAIGIVAIYFLTLLFHLA